MSDKYNPPFCMTEEITNLIVEIGELVGTISTFESMNPNPVLRRESRIKTIYSSLAIEQNTLSLDQVTDVVNGKRILGVPKDIHEVKNAYEVYEKASELNPYKLTDLLKAHKIMMSGLVKEAGIFRSGNVGIYAGTFLIHAGTPAKYVPDLMKQLFEWLKKSKYHPLVKSCIFHYEFEFIHPFQDGNGRMGRLWQSLILQAWKEIFAWLPVETLIHENQEEYYKVLQVADSECDSTLFVEFMLQMIRDALREISVTQRDRDVVGGVVDDVVVSMASNEDNVIRYLKKDGSMSSKQLSDSIGVTQRQVQRILANLKEHGIIIRHGNNKSGYWEVVEK